MSGGERRLIIDDDLYGGLTDPLYQCLCIVPCNKHIHHYYKRISFESEGLIKLG